MTLRDYKIALFGGLLAFGVVAGTDGHYIAAGVFWAIGPAIGKDLAARWRR